MKKPSGLRNGAGRPRGKKPTPAADTDESVVMTFQDVAEYLHCSYATDYGLARHGEFWGSSWRFLRSDIDKWIAKGSGRRQAANPNRAGNRRKRP
jgi:excisionase family DNA binding protein